MNRSPRIVIVGAGLAGIATAQRLHADGFTDITVCEKGADVGGVWHWNRYPGLTCDVPSHIYQFSFAPKPDWSGIWASGGEIQRYHRDVVDRFGLGEYLRLSTEVTAADYHEASATWTVRITRGDGTREDLTADFLICATGVLHHPRTPAITGMDSFAGPMVHSARWDPALDLAGKRIGVIGTGSTGVQLVSALQPRAAELTHFVRSPQWILWAPMGIPQPRALSRLLRRHPRLLGRMHAVLLWGSGILADVTTRPSWRRRAVQAYARLCLRAQVRNHALRARLTPDYQPLCKRQVVSGTYYRVIQAPNAQLVTDPIERVEPGGIRTADGALHELDAIVLATGFDAHAYMRPMSLTGRAGTTLESAWSGGPRAYRMTAVPGFPNMFTVLGPNSPVGSISLQYSAELTAGYISQWLARWSAQECDTIEVTEEATDRFNADVAEAMGPTVWNTGCNSWYFTEDGRVDLWPFDRAAMTRMLAKPEPGDFHLGGTPAQTSAAERPSVATGDGRAPIPLTDS